MNTPTGQPTPTTALWTEALSNGSHWSGVLRRGTWLRISDLAGGANVAALFFNYEDRLERYNMADTLKAQHTAFLTAGCVCYSDMGRIFCSIVSDTCGWHDTLCGVSDAAEVTAKYGVSRFQEARNNFHKNGHDSLVNELAKHGLGRRDLVANVNFFSKVVTDETGQLHFESQNSRAGYYVDLRFEMHTLVALATCQHPFDPETKYRPRPVRLTAWNGGCAPADDPCRKRCAENERGFRNTEMMFLPP